jgi:phosphatidylglycerol lysyltransferase
MRLVILAAVSREGRVVALARRTETKGRSLIERLRGRPGLLAPRALPRADNALLGMEQRRRRRRWAVLAIAVVAVADVVGAVVPRTRGHLAILERNFPLGLSEGGRALLLVAGLLLLLLARGLARGYRRAWVGALFLTVASAVLHLAGNLDPIAAGLALVPPVYLWTIRDAFVAHARPLTLRSLLSLPWFFGGLLLYGLVGWSELAEQLPNRNITSRIDAILRSAFFLTTAPSGDTALARAFIRSFQLFGAASLLLVATLLLQPVVIRLAHHTDTRARARFLDRWGRTGMAALAGLPENEALELAGGKVLLGYREISGVAIGVGDPVGEPGTEQQALGDFVTTCERNGWTPVLLAASHATAERARRYGFESVAIGEEAVVDLQGFSMAGKERAKLRQNNHRAERDGVVIKPYGAQDRSPSIDAQLREISDEWLKLKHGPELGFTLGRLDLDAFALYETWIALVGGRVVAFTTWLPYLDGKATILDLVRRRSDSPVGTMELLIVRALEAFRDRGLKEASLNAIPLACVDRPAGARCGDDDEDSRLRDALRWLYDHGGAVYEAKNLFRFKSKFAPRWEPMYLVYPESANLARIATTVGIAYLPNGLVATVRGLTRRGPVRPDAPDNCK